MPKAATPRIHLAGWCKTCRTRAIWKSSKTNECWWCDCNGKAKSPLVYRPKRKA